MQYCNTDACGWDALCRHYVMSLFDRYMLQPATACTEEALWAQYMSVLLKRMSFSGSSTLFYFRSGESEERTCPGGWS
eukprot:1848488-Prymnesium_polylepis.1